MLPGRNWPLETAAKRGQCHAWSRTDIAAQDEQPLPGTGWDPRISVAGGRHGSLLQPGLSPTAGPNA